MLITNKYTSIGRITKPDSANFGYYQPEQHAYYKQLRRFNFGSECQIAQVIVPSGALVSGGSLRCRKCGDYRIPFGSLSGSTSSGLTNHKELKAKAKAARQMNQHEENCKGEVKSDERKALEAVCGGDVEQHEWARNWMNYMTVDNSELETVCSLHADNSEFLD